MWRGLLLCSAVSLSPYLELNTNGHNIPSIDNLTIQVVIPKIKLLLLLHKCYNYTNETELSEPLDLREHVHRAYFTETKSFKLCVHLTTFELICEHCQYVARWPL